MRVNRTEEIAKSFINGNISWVKDQIKRNPVLMARVATWLKEYAPSELNSFLRIMGR